MGQSRMASAEGPCILKETLHWEELASHWGLERRASYLLLDHVHPVLPLRRASSHPSLAAPVLSDLPRQACPPREKIAGVPSWKV